MVFFPKLHCISLVLTVIWLVACRRDVQLSFIRWWWMDEGARRRRNRMLLRWRENDAKRHLTKPWGWRWTLSLLSLCSHAQTSSQQRCCHAAWRVSATVKTRASMKGSCQCWNLRDSCKRLARSAPCSNYLNRPIQNLFIVESVN